MSVTGKSLRLGMACAAAALTTASSDSCCARSSA